METFKPVEISEYFLRQIAAGLKKNIKDTIFNPIFAILRDNNVINSKNALETAILSGRVYYSDGAFRSNNAFSNAVATELESIGAKFKYSAYYIDRALLPVDIESVLAIVKAREDAKKAALLALLAVLALNISKEKPNSLPIEKPALSLFGKLERDLFESTALTPKDKKRLDFEMPLIDSPEVASFEEQLEKVQGQEEEQAKDDDNDLIIKDIPQVFKTSKETRKIAKDYVYNTNYWVKKWKAKEIVKMRRDVLEMINKGDSITQMKVYFMKEWGVSERKAEFLARNEASIAESVIKATHYQSQGCDYFMWIRSTSKEKRPQHLEYSQEYNNKYGVGGTNIFPYANPPVIDETTGQTGLPRQTYNCRCGQVGVKNPSYWINRRKIENAKRNIFTKIAYELQNSKQRNNRNWRYRRFGEGETL